MALRLLLVGLVAGLSLDLPQGGPDEPPGRVAQRWLDLTFPQAFPSAGPSVAVAEPKAAPEVAPMVAQAAPVAEATAIKPEMPTTTLRPTAMIEPTLPILTTIPTETVVEIFSTQPILPGRAEAAALASAVEIPAATEPTPTSTPTPTPSPEAVAGNLPTTPAAEAAEAPAPVSVAEATDPDAAFSSIVSEMAATFAADTTPTTGALLASSEPVDPAPANPPAPAADELAGLEPVEDLYPGLAYALNRENEGLDPIPSEAHAVEARAEPPAPVATIEDAEPSADSSRATRLAHAMKLTGQAVHAWAGLLSQGPSASVLQR